MNDDNRNGGDPNAIRTPARAVDAPAADDRPADARTADAHAAERARQIILDRRRRFMAAAMAGLGVSAEACDSTQQQSPFNPANTATQDPTNPSVCLMFPPANPPSVCLSPQEPNVCLSMTVDPPPPPPPPPPMQPTVCLEPPWEEPRICLSIPWEPMDAGTPGEDAEVPEDAAVIDEEDAGQ